VVRAAGKVRAVYARARARGEEGKNKTEVLFESEVLKMRLAAKDIEAYWYEPFSINLNGVMYRPDYMVHKADGEIILYDCKALLKDGTPLVTPEGKNKLELLRSRFPFRVFIAAWNRSAGWKYFEVE
jgi:hypothetical protein